MSAPLLTTPPATAATEAEVYENLPPWLERRPTKRAECPPPDQQCPWASCRYHLALDVRKRHRLTRQARITYNLPPDPEDWPADAKTCALHVADDGALTLEQLGALVGDISRERARQIEQAALDKLAAFGIVLDLGEDLGLDTDTRAPAHKRPTAEAKGHHSPRIRDADSDLDGTYIGAFRSQDMTAKMRRIQAESAAPARTLSPDDIDLVALAEDLDRKRGGKPAPSPRKQSISINVFAQRAAQRAAKEAMPPTSPPGVRLDRVGAPGEPSAPMTPKVYLVPKTPAPNPQNDPPKSADPVPQNETPPPTSTPCPPSNPTPSPIEMQPAQTADATPSVPPISPPDDHPKAAEVAEAVSSTPPTLSRLSARSLRQHAKAASRTLRVLMVERRINRAELLRLVSAATSCAPTTVETSIDHLLAGAMSTRSVWYRRAATALGVALADLCADPLWVLSVVTEDVAHMRASHVRRTPKPTPQVEAAPQITAPQIEAAPPPLLPLPPAPTPIEDLARAAQAALSHCVQLTADAEGLRAKVRDLETHNTHLRDRVATLEARLSRIATEARNP